MTCKPLKRSVNFVFTCIFSHFVSKYVVPLGSSPAPLASRPTLAMAALWLVLLDSPIKFVFINNSFSAPPPYDAGLAI
jgi:hypothetical protein